MRVNEGEGVSGRVLREGRPLVVRDMTAAGQQRGPAERRYKIGVVHQLPADRSAGARSAS